MNGGTSPRLSQRKSLQRQRRPREYTLVDVQEQLDNALTSGQNVAQVVRQILEECQSESADSVRKAVFQHCIEQLNKDRLQSQMAKELVGKLLIEVDSLDGASLVELAELLIKGVKEGEVGNGRSLELFPKILSVVAAQTSIRYQKDGGGCGEMEGTEHKSHLLNSLCSCRWAPSSVLHVTNMCREIPMTSDELQFLIEKILRMMQSLDLSELPPLVYQLLVLSTKGHKTLVLEGIQTLFNQLDENVLSGGPEGEDVVAVSGGPDELLQAEGTVILHITFALKQDQELGKEFVKNLKVVQSRASSSSLSPFSVALCLSVARIHRFEEPVFDFLKAVIVKCYKDEDRRVASKWMQEVYQDAPDMEKLLLDTVQHSVCGWDHVVQGLVVVGFNLMDSFAPKSATPSFSTSQYRACCLGSKILLNSFKAHLIVHQEIISQLINRILTNASSYVSHYIGLLSDVIGTTPQVALDSVPQLREAFSYLALLPPTPALELLQAILPLVQYSASVRDSLLLVLRKSLFSRQVEARKIAVSGYLLLLRKFKVLESAGVNGSQASQLSSTGSQTLVEVHTSGGSSGMQSGYEALCLEILGILRRCLAQQCEVRTTLYEGLYEVFCGNPKLAEPILDLLINQFQRYYESEVDMTPPVKLEPCLTAGGSGVHRTEPLDRLVQCLQLSVSQFVTSHGEEEVGEIPAVVGEAQDTLQSLVERMIKSEPEDFELDKSADFSSSSSVGQKNRLLAKTVIGLYETLLEYAFTVGEFSQESCEQVLKLHHGYQRVLDILTEKTSSAAGAKRGSSGAAPSKTEPSALSLQATIQLLRAVFSDTIPGHQQPLTVLRDSHLFVKYLLTTALQKIHQISEKGTCDGLFHYCNEEKIFKGCCALSRVLFKQVGTTGAQRDSGRKDKGKSVPVLCLEGFSQLLQTVNTRYPHKMETFLTNVNPTIEENTSRNDRVHFFVRHFQWLVTGMLNGTIKDWSMREAHIMVSTIGLLASELSVDSKQLDQVYEWTHAQCKEQNVDDAQVTKALVSLLLTLNARQKGSVKIIRKLSQDVHYHLGDIDEDVELECRPHFAIVNPRTAASSLLGLIYSHTEQVLNDADWLIGRLKCETSSTSLEEIFDGISSPQLGTQAEGLCSSLCERLMNFVVSCHELVQSAVSPGPATEGLLKTVTKVYTVIGNLTKYYISIFGQLSHIIQSFKRMVEMVGTHLSQQVYSLINYIQLQTAEQQQQQDRGKKGKGKGKEASKGKAKVRREMRSIPGLIYAMEQFEKFLIQLSKKSKVNLMENFKRSTSRDFRINGQTVEAILNIDEMEEEEEEEEEEPEGSEGSEGGGGIPKPKKLKRS